MIHILLVSREKNIFKALESGFSDLNITFDWTNSGQDALSRLSRDNFNLFITEEQLPDYTARELIEKVLFKNAMMDSVVLSSLSHDDFHKAYEGLGVLMQFPPEPGKEDAKNLLVHLERIARIAGQTGKSV